MEEEKTTQSKKEEKDNKKDKKNQKKQEDELSEEDKELKQNIELLVQRIMENNQVSETALEQLKEIVRKSTASITSVPKPFKFLKDHYQNLVKFYESLPPNILKRKLSDFLSVLSMTMAEDGKQITLKYLKQGTQKDMTQWGHGYLQHLAKEICQEYNLRLNENLGVDDLLEYVKIIIPVFFLGNAEHDVIDLLMEVDKLEDLIENQEVSQHITETNYFRVIQYLQICALYCVDMEEMLKTLRTAYQIAMKQNVYTIALRLAIKLDDNNKIKEVFQTCQDEQIKKQLCFMVARQRLTIEDLELTEDQTKITSNSMLSSYYLKLAQDLDQLKPKHPDQVYKLFLEDKKHTNQPDYAKANLADTYVNAFVNCGTKKDALIKKEDKSGTDWIWKLKGDGSIAAVASIGLIDLWDIDEGQQDINAYLETQDGYPKMGACIAIGVFCSGQTSEVDPAKAFLNDFIGGKEQYSKLGSIIGIGIAYAGSARESFIEDLVPIVVDGNLNVEVRAYAALSLGLIFVGTSNEDVSASIIDCISDLFNSSPKLLDQTVSRFFAVGLGLLFLGAQEICEPIIELLDQSVVHPISKYAQICIEGCAYVGSGNVLKVQKMLHLCIEHLEEAKGQHQQIAVLAIALIASSEDIGNEMAMRTMNHLLQYCDIVVKRAVPLAIALLHISNPKISVIDILIKLCHDEDSELSTRAILSMGLVGAGTNNARIGDILRDLATYYTKESNGMYIVRIAQGLLYLGKGMLTLQPYYSDRYLLSKVGMAGLITLLHSALDMKNILLEKYHYNLFYLTLSIYPKMLFTLDENLENKVINLRVGQAVDVVGQTGNPKKITGFQTHTSPVLINYGQRAELATEEFILQQDTVLENFVIIKKNPDYVPEEEKPKKKNSISNL